MTRKENYDFSNLVNETEELVFEELEYQLDQDWTENICRCEDCLLDMAALSLNSLEPRYRVSLLGSLYASALHDDEQAREEVRQAVIQAISKIHENPAHNR
ncbi:MAG: late competence development ComFB family protein [Spirochaetales bacterium]|jgi:competence protein ComFB|nr:late competence development ComFB family protein [Spirochaetales bacterium]